MAYEINVNGILVKCDTIEEARGLLGLSASQGASQAPPPEKKTHPEKGRGMSLLWDLGELWHQVEPEVTKNEGKTRFSSQNMDDVTRVKTALKLMKKSDKPGFCDSILERLAQSIQEKKRLTPSLQKALDDIEKERKRLESGE